jgi:hypothetical protein
MYTYIDARQNKHKFLFSCLLTHADINMHAIHKGRMCLNARINNAGTRTQANVPTRANAVFDFESSG